MCAVKSFRQKHFDRPADDFVMQKAEQGTNLPVREADRTGRIDDQQSIGRGIERAARKVWCNRIHSANPAARPTS
jgi:hypothetical protein